MQTRFHPTTITGSGWSPQCPPRSTVDVSIRRRRDTRRRRSCGRVVLVATNEDDAVNPADEPSSTVTVTVPPAPPPRALLAVGSLEPGTYFVDEVDGTPTPRIFVTIGAGWGTTSSGASHDRRPSHRTPTADAIAFSRPQRRVLRRLPLERWVSPGASGHRRRSRRRAQRAAGMGRRDRPVGHLHRRLRRQSIPTHRPRRHLGLRHQDAVRDVGRWAAARRSEAGDRACRVGATNRARSRPCGSSTSTARSSSSTRDCGRSHRRRLTLSSPPCSTRSASSGMSPAHDGGADDGLRRRPRRGSDMTDRFDEMRVPPDTVLDKALRQRPHGWRAPHGTTTKVDLISTTASFVSNPNTPSFQRRRTT